MYKLILLIVIMFLFCGDEKSTLEDEPCDSELLELLVLEHEIKTRRDSLWDEQHILIKKIEKLTCAQKKQK